MLCDVVLRERFEIVGPDPLYLRRPDAMEPGQAEAGQLTRRCEAAGGKNIEVRSAYSG